jgi:hypothetical protein
LTTKNYTPGNFTQIQDPSALGKFVTQELAKISNSIDLANQMFSSLWGIISTGIAYTLGVVSIGTTTPWSLATFTVRTGTNQNLAISGTNLLPNGITINSFNDAVSVNEGIEIRASKVYFPQGPLALCQPTTSYPSANIPSGTAPTSPADGDIWYDGTNLKFRLGGTTKTFTLV